MAKRKLNDIQERDVALSYLCRVSPDYISSKWGVREVTIRNNILGKRSSQWNDELVDFFKEVVKSGSRYANAIHLYLIVNDQLEELPNTQLVNRLRDNAVYDAVDKDIFFPRTEKLIDETNLRKILTSIEKPGPDDLLLAAIFGQQNYEKAHDFVNRLLFPYLKESYKELSEKKGKSLDSIYD